MNETFFKCTLLSDVVLNSRLATEGNMTTLDYLSGSNFLGVTAMSLYDRLDQSQAYTLFHSGEVSFGDALIFDGNEMSYHMPLSIMMRKGEESLLGNDVFLHHLINENNYPKERLKDRNSENNAQLQQKRNGFINTQGQVVSKVIKTFALKSAQDANKRKSKEGAMFGFEAIRQGQQFIFSVQFTTERYMDMVKSALIGNRKIGKSRTAQYGQVKIEEIDPPTKVTCTTSQKFCLVYVQSNLCFLDGFGQACLRPTSQQLGFSTGTIDWSKSQVRVFSYSPWNGKRNCTNTQRDCIAMGSVFYISGASGTGARSIGEYQAEGLGRILVNPAFLEGDDHAISTFFTEKPRLVVNKDDSVEPGFSPSTPLGKHLEKLRIAKSMELELSRQVQVSVKNSRKTLAGISASQWGAIRNLSTRYTDMDALQNTLYGEKAGYLQHGVAYDKYWGKNNEQKLKEFKTLFDNNREYGPYFIAKFAAEMAKLAKK